ncbi:uncharacterized protein B0H18DRAFT_1004609 [Fomitopsis serialis]|uniref:uncharacterized protein n=1 Tax=Fomitopsis serialis TaxID=139415 RepID=UPI0020083B8F|nr:uncharacterized protein B0H18DRAFT_1004609 [Neoantrodia serialis]KAH9926940.1 hypothetical protein B0H18DRAFT_1004609 [Neoantrodia serialis]
MSDYPDSYTCTWFRLGLQRYSSGNPPDPHLPPNVRLYSPGNSFNEHNSFSLPQSLLLGSGNPQRFLPDLESRKAVVHHKAWQFEDVLEAVGLVTDADAHLRAYLMQIYLLQKEWEQADCTGFVAKNIVNVNEAQYRMLQKKIQEILELPVDEAESEFERCVAFIQDVRIDFWRSLGKVVAIAPTSQADLTRPIVDRVANILREAEPNSVGSTLDIVPKSFVEVPDLMFYMNDKTVHQHATYTPQAPGPMIFFCIIAQSQEEFTYETKKMSLAVPHLSQLQGFIIALIMRAEPQALSNCLFQDGTLCDPMECRVLAYCREDFDAFLQCAARSQSIKDWEKEANFMWLTSITWGPKMFPHEGWARFTTTINTIFASYGATAVRDESTEDSTCTLSFWSPEDRLAIVDRLPNDIALRLKLAVLRAAQRVSERVAARRRRGRRDILCRGSARW